VRTQGPLLDLALEQVWMHTAKSHPLVQHVRPQGELSDLDLQVFPAEPGPGDVWSLVTAGPKLIVLQLRAQALQSE
jgi:hypothetical protein